MVTEDLSKFGEIERSEAGLLLSTLKSNSDNTNYLGEGVKVMFNSNSGLVFLTDEDFNVAIMENGKLEDFFTSPYGGLEGTYSKLEWEKENMCSEDLEWFNELEVL